MRVLVFGATGRIGRHVRAAARAAGHELVLFAREPTRLTPLEKGETVFAGDVANQADVEQAVDGVDAVISVLGPRSNAPEQAALFADFAQALVDSMHKRGTRRLVSLSGAAVRVPGEQKRPLDRLASLVVERAVRHVVAAKQRELEIIAASDLDWVAPRPPRVVDGPATGKYRAGDHGVGPRSRISGADLADFIVDQLTDDSHLRTAPYISY